MKTTSKVIAFCLGGLITLALFGAFQLGYERGQRSAREEMANMVTVFIATMELRQGSVIDKPEKQFRRVQMSKDTAPANAISEMSELKGMQLLRTLDAGQICTREKVGKYEARNKLPAGRRDLTIRAQVSEPGQVTPGSRVDVLAITPSKEEASGTATIIIVEDVPVLAIEGTEVDRNGTTNLTLALTPTQIKIIMRFSSEKGVTLKIVRAKPQNE